MAVDTKEAQLIMLSRQCNVRVPKGLYAELGRQAKRRKMTLSAYVREALAKVSNWRG